MKGPDVDNLTNWLTTLQPRHITIHLNPRQITGPTTPHDQHMAQTHAHALTTAPDHPNWWNHIVNGTNGTGLTPDDIPVSPDDPDAYACTTCAAPAHQLDHQLLPWCTNHTPQETR